jgi:MFS family permease
VVAGTIREAAHPAPIVVAPAVQRIRISREAPSALSRVTSGVGSLAKTVAMYLLFGFLGALIVYLFRGHLETVSDTVSYSFGRSFLAGLAAEVLFIPIGIVMLVLVVTAIALPFYAIAFALLSLLGYVSVAHAVGENLTRRRFSWTDRMRRANSYYYVLNGLGVLVALFVGAAITQMIHPLSGWLHDLLILAAWILTWIAATSGLGAAVLSRAGTRRTFARPHELPELPAESLAEEMAPAGVAGARRRSPGGAR